MQEEEESRKSKRKRGRGADSAEDPVYGDLSEYNAVTNVLKMVDRDDWAPQTMQLMHSLPKVLQCHSTHPQDAHA